jgi:homoserine kinase type II
VIVRDSAIIAILDFDELAWDYCVSDLAHSGVYLGTLFRNWGPTPPQARQLLIDGYQSIRALTNAELGWLAFLVRWESIGAGWAIEDAQVK